VVALSVLDLVPIASGSSAAAALHHTVELAQRAEALGYRRYWIAEHHLNTGVAGTAPPLVIALVAGATRTIRVGSGAMQLGHQTPLSVVEQFGLLDALHPGRIDLGLGRSTFRRPRSADGSRPADPYGGRGAPTARRTERGLLIPARVSMARLLASPRFALQAELLQQPGAQTPEYAEQVDDILALLTGTYSSPAGGEAHVVPGEHAGVEVWIVGSSAGVSAEVAGRRALPFAASYHITPASVLDAVVAYRDAFCPSPTLPAPRVLVSADVVVATDDASARRLASPYGLWVRNIRVGAGAVPYPTPEEAAAHEWDDDDRALVVDRVDTQIVGSPATAADQLEVLVDETGADELMITTMTHDPADRLRSYELLAAEWSARAPARSAVESPRCSRSVDPE
jgi:luciferase family oxidoreductase group 1